MTPATEELLIPTAADLLEQVEGLGGIPLYRVLLRPIPGTATEEDLLALLDGANKRLCELVDGVLVEKALGWYESRLGAVLIEILGPFAREHKLGLILGADAPIGLRVGLLRLPDVSFVSWGRFPDRQLPSGQVLRMPPDLAVEVLSPGNTKSEMARKRREYFAAGTRLVWELDPKTRSCEVFATPESPDECTALGEEGVLEGADVLPGFRLGIRQWFEMAGPPPEQE